METTSIRNIKQDGGHKLQELRPAGAPGSGPIATGGYRKFQNQSGKVYIPIIDAWTQWTGRKVRFSRRLYRKAQAAFDHSVAAGNRYIRFVTFCKELEEALSFVEPIEEEYPNEDYMEDSNEEIYGREA